MSNAVFHGIEEPQKRLERRKAEAGAISVAGADTGSGIEIVVSDDGAGFDVNRIRQRARAMGTLIAEDATDRQVVPLIFQQGFSTAATASMGAGRGVGLSYVLETVRKLGGELNWGHTSGRGTLFKLTFPHA